MDAFSEVLSGVKLQGAVFFHAEFTNPWGFESPRSKNLAPVLLPGASHLIVYHFLMDGQAEVHAFGRTLHLEAGDIVMFPHGDAHILAGGEPGTLIDEGRLIQRIQERNLGPMCFGGGGDTAHFVCGFMACDERLCGPILNGLPPVLKVSIRGDASGRQPAGRTNWLESSIRHLVEEAGSGAAGSDAMLAKLSEALFVDTLRRFMVSLPAEETGWLAAARDEVVGKALALLHSRVAHPWTLASLAKEVGLSRSSLAERFGKYLGEPPISYLTHWRLQLGARALISTPHSVAEIASDVGYESEAAFNRAFKRQFGQPPARFRKEQRSNAQQAGAKPTPPEAALAEAAV